MNKSLFTAFTLGDLELSNRMVMAPMTRNRAGEGLAPLFAVRITAAAVGALPDRNLQSGIRVINGATDRLDRAIIANGDLASPLIPALPFAAPSSYEILPPASNVITVTPATNTSATETEITIPTGTGSLHTLLITGDSNGLSALSSPDNRRPITTEARVTILNAASQFQVLDLYIVPPGTDITTLFPGLQVTTPAISQPIPFAPGDYEVIFQETATATTVAGPLPVTLDGGGIYGILAVDGATTSTADIVLIDDFN